MTVGGPKAATGAKPSATCLESADLPENETPAVEWSSSETLPRLKERLLRATPISAIPRQRSKPAGADPYSLHGILMRRVPSSRRGSMQERADHPWSAQSIAWCSCSASIRFRSSSRSLRKRAIKRRKPHSWPRS
jgi:hypothetical protein